MSFAMWRCVFPFPWRSTLYFVCGLLFLSEKDGSSIFQNVSEFLLEWRSHIPEDVHHNAVRTSYLINYKQKSARCYSFYSNWRSCRNSLPILALLCTYFHEFSQYFSDNYSAISIIFHFFARATQAEEMDAFPVKLGRLVSGILHCKLNIRYLVFLLLHRAFWQHLCSYHQQMHSHKLHCTQ